MNVLAVTPLDPVTRGDCPLCKKKDQNLVWQILLFNGSRCDAVCMDCGGSIKEKAQRRGEMT